MARVVITPTASADLARMIRTHSLPPDTMTRFKHSVAALSQFPLIGAALRDRWSAYRFVLGPWRWMIIVYVFDRSTDQVAIVTVQDAQTAGAATSA